MSNIKITQEVDIEISVDDLLEQVNAGDLLDGLEESIGLTEIIDNFNYGTVLDSIRDTYGLDCILGNFKPRLIVDELVSDLGVQKVQDYLNEHHVEAVRDASLEQKLEGVSLEDLAKHLIKKYSVSALLSTFAIATEESFQGKEV